MTPPLSGGSAIERLDRAVWDSRVSPSKRDIGFLIDANKVMREALESIAEYWNRDRNDSAMHDACWHAINTADEALAKARGETL
jgi:hypothetical protein